MLLSPPTMVKAGALAVVCCGLALACSSGSSEGGPGSGASRDVDADQGMSAATAGRGPDSSSTATTDRDSGSSGVQVGERDAGAATPVDTSSWPLLDCARDAEGTGPIVHAAIAERVRGSNGERADRCDATGNLIEYRCETRTECEGGINPGCTYFQTGLVRPALLDCAGRCRDGACDEACPSPGGTIVYEEANGAGLFLVRSEADDERYTCTVAFDNDRDDYDCTTAPRAGDRARIDLAGGGASGNCRNELRLAVVAEGTDVPPNTSQCSLSCRPGTVEPAQQTSAAPMTCPAEGPAAMPPEQGSPGEARRLTGSNGEHADSCTADGNLIDYQCVVLSLSSGPPWTAHTGAVGARLIDCGGSCRDATCVTACPQAGQTLRFESELRDDAITVRNETEGRRYACVLAGDDPSDAFDCEGLGPARTGTIAPSLLNVGSGCTPVLPEIPVLVDGEAGACSTCAHCRLSCRIAP